MYLTGLLEFSNYMKKLSSKYYRNGNLTKKVCSEIFRGCGTTVTFKVQLNDSFSF